MHRAVWADCIPPLQIDPDGPEFEQRELIAGTHIASERRAHSCQKFRRTEGLRHVVIGPASSAAIFCSSIVRADSTMMGTGDQLRTLRITSDRRHPEVPDPRVADPACVPATRHRLEQPLRLLSPGIPRTQQRLEDFADRRIILDDQDQMHRLRQAGSAVGSVNSIRVPQSGARALRFPRHGHVRWPTDRKSSPTPTIVPSPVPRWNFSNSSAGCRPQPDHRHLQ